MIDSRRRPWLVTCLLAVLTGVAAPGLLHGQRSVQIPPLTPRVAWGTAVMPPPDTTGLRFDLVQGGGPEAGPTRLVETGGRALTPAQVAALLARVAPPAPDPLAADTFAFAGSRVPLPRDRHTVEAPFPTRETPRPAPVVAAIPVGVSRRAPEGETPVGAGVTIGFNQPMVPLAALSRVDSVVVPVRLQPSVPGRWRWLDVRTLRFEPAGRLPMATHFQVEVAGARSVSGAVMTHPERWSFSTPALLATGAYPTGAAVRPRDLLLVVFDQEVDPATLLPWVRLTADGRKLPVRLATAEEVQADSAVRGLVAHAPSGRWLALRPVNPLPLATAFTVRIVPGAPSREGPVATTDEQVWSFRTYGPLRVVHAGCGWGDGCHPGDPWIITYTNPLAATAATRAAAEVRPGVQGLSVTVWGNRLYIRGRTLPHTAYEVHVGAGLRDVYGQSLVGESRYPFRVHSARTELVSPYRQSVVLDPAGPATIYVRSRGHAALRVQLRRLDPSGLAAVGTNDRWDRLKPPGRFAGELVWSGIVRPEQAPDVSSRVPIDVSPALRGGLGLVLVVVEPVEPASREDPVGLAIGVQATRLGVAAMQDGDSLVAWATSLVDGRPVAGAQVQVVPYGRRTGVTDTLGLARVGLAPGSDPRIDHVLVTRSGEDVAVLLEGSWEESARGRKAIAYLWTDRDVYRPGERVHLKGWIREWREGPWGGLRMLRSPDRVRLSMVGEDGREVRSDTLPLTELGGFDLQIPLSAQMEVGDVKLRVALMRPGPGWEAGEATIHVQEYRRPEFRVQLDRPEVPLVVGESAEVAARVTYYSGGGLAGARVEWSASARQSSFTPPGRGDWSFGPAGSWWWWDFMGQRGGGTIARTLSGATDARGMHAARLQVERAVPAYPHHVHLRATVHDASEQTWTEQTDVLVHPARAYVGLRTPRRWVLPGDSVPVEVMVVGLDGVALPGLPVSLRALRTRWALDWTERTDTLPECCDMVSGGEPARCLFTAPRDGWLQVVATVRDGKGRPSRSEANVWVGGAWFGAGARPHTAEQAQILVLADRETYRPGDTARVLATLPFHPARGLLTLRRGGLVRTEPFTTTDGTYVFRIPLEGRDIPDLHLQVDAVATPAPGDTVAGTAFASGGVDLSVERAARSLTVDVTPRDTLLAPQGSTPVALRVRDAAGRPVAGAEVALAVVDESVLALTGYRLRDPLALFYPERDAGVYDSRLRPRVVLAPRPQPPGTVAVRGTVTGPDGQPEPRAQVRLENTELRTVTDEGGEFLLGGVPPGSYVLVVSQVGYRTVRVPVQVTAALQPLRVTLDMDVLALESVVVSGMGAAGSLSLQAVAVPEPAGYRERGTSTTAIHVRSDFTPLAAFVARVRTDAAGNAVAPITLPDNLTRYRVMVAAVADSTLYGLGEAGVTAGQSLMVRPSPPRFLTQGDSFRLPVVVQNRSAGTRIVRVALRAEGLAFDEGGREVSVPGGGRVQVSFAGRAARVGTARVQVVASAAGASDAAELALPVLAPATAEAFAVYGTLDSGAVVLPLAIGPEVSPAYGGLEVTLASTAVQELTDAVIDLQASSMESAEQVASRIIAMAGLRDVLTSFRAAGVPDSATLRYAMIRDVATLAERQNPDGSFRAWPEPETWRWKFLSVHVTHALERARSKGYAVPAEVLARAVGYLERIDREREEDASPAVRSGLRAYAAYVRGRVEPGSGSQAAARLADEVGVVRLPLDAQAWMLSTLAGDRRYAALADSLRRVVEGRAQETAGRATFASGYVEGEYLMLPSAARTDALVLEALMLSDPASELVPKTARELLARRRRGAWDRSHANGWALLALDGYFRRYESVEPAFTGGAWLGSTYAGGQPFRGRSAVQHRITVPMHVLAADTSARALTLGRTGAGRMYYRAALRYATPGTPVGAEQRGFAVTRAYEAVDDSADVRRGADGVWHVRTGARVRVTITTTAPAVRHHVAVVDPLPAGLEPINPELLGSDAGPPADGTPGRPTSSPRYRWSYRWYDHDELRDDRAAIFAFSLPAGVYTYTYLARAITPGVFTAPPTRAAEMYDPETFGRGATERVVVEP